MLNAEVQFNKYFNIDLRVGPELIAQDLIGMKYGLIFKSSPFKDWFYFLTGLGLHQNAGDDRATFGNYNTPFKLLSLGIGFIATKVLSIEFAYTSVLGSNAYTYEKKILSSGEIQKMPIEKFISTIKFGIGLNWEL